LLTIQCPPKRSVGRKYAKSILRTGGYMLELIIDEYLSFILRTAQHWLELTKEEFSNST
jgi:hypothetical protein